MEAAARTCERIGHGGASALAPANTLASFDAALDVGVDMVEFDVRGHQRELVLAHTVLHARFPRGVRLGEALAHLSSRRFAEVHLNVDLKHPGCEAALLERLRGAGLLDRTLISSQVPEVLDRLRARDPDVRLGISVGGRLARASRRWRDWRAHVLAGLSTGRWDALMAQYRLVDERLLADVQERAGRLYAWTVNERPMIDRLRRLGVHGITTADPRLFV
jgi:glycerophosphoryl diester phosphodiesterase